MPTVTLQLGGGGASQGVTGGAITIIRGIESDSINVTCVASNGVDPSAVSSAYLQFASKQYTSSWII